MTNNRNYLKEGVLELTNHAFKPAQTSQQPDPSKNFQNMIDSVQNLHAH